MLPWLVVLLLLLVKSNRCGLVWWIWLPLGCMAVAEQLLRPAFGFLPSVVADQFLDMTSALTFGIAAVWLLAPQLARSHRLLTFLCILVILAGFSFFSFLVRQDWDMDSMSIALVLMFPLSVGILVIATAILLTGLACRGHYRPQMQYLLIFLSLLTLWLMIIMPFFVIAVIATGGQILWRECGEVLISILVLSATNFATLLPFLVLSASNSLFRERLKALLHVKPEGPPPLNAPLPDTQLKV